jgi:hypothetical protein
MVQDLIFMEALEKIIFKLTGRKVPVFSVMDVDDQKVKTIQFGRWKENPNSILEKWDVKGAQKTKAGRITFIDESGVSRQAFFEHKGATVDLYISKEFADLPDREKVIGGLLTIDIFGELLDIGKSSKNILIGFLIGCAVYATFIGPILQAMMK